MGGRRAACPNLTRDGLFEMFQSIAAKEEETWVTGKLLGALQTMDRFRYWFCWTAPHWDVDFHKVLMEWVEELPIQRMLPVSLIHILG